MCERYCWVISGAVITCWMVLCDLQRRRVSKENTAQLPDHREMKPNRWQPGAVYKSDSQTLFTFTVYNTPYLHTPISMFHSWQYTVTVVILAGPKHIQTTLFWFCPTKKCAASFSCLLISCLLAEFIFAVLPLSLSYASLPIWPSCHDAGSSLLSYELLKHPFPQIILVPSHKCLPVCFAVQGCVNSDLCV